MDAPGIGTRQNRRTGPFGVQFYAQGGVVTQARKTDCGTLHWCAIWGASGRN